MAPSKQISGEKQYRMLCEQGMSEAKAARIVNTSRSKTGKRGGSAPKYEEWNNGELYDKARKIGIEGRPNMDRQQLIQALRSH